MLPEPATCGLSTVLRIALTTNDPSILWERVLTSVRDTEERMWYVQVWQTFYLQL